VDEGYCLFAVAVPGLVLRGAVDFVNGGGRTIESVDS